MHPTFSQPSGNSGTSQNISNSGTSRNISNSGTSRNISNEKSSQVRALSDGELLGAVSKLVEAERRITLDLLVHLREVERRMLFAQMGYGSLYDFAVKHVGLSEGAAYRRIAAMRLVQDLPEARKELESGRLTLSNAAKLQSVFRAHGRKVEKIPTHAGPVHKTEVLKQVLDRSQKECEDALLGLLVEGPVKNFLSEKARRTGVDTVELRLILSREVYSRLQSLKNYLSHSVPSGSTLKVFEYLIDQEIDRRRKKLGLANPVSSSRSSGTTALSGPSLNSNPSSSAQVGGPQRSSNQTVKRTSLGYSLRKAVWRRAGGVCETPGCGSRFQLEVDHCIPVSKGGLNELGNLRLLCRTHNQQQAQAALGSQAMKSFLPSLR